MQRYDYESSYLGGSMVRRDDGDYVQWDAVQPLIEALESIEKGEGPFSRDPLKHAENVIENMQAIARAALAAAQEPAAQGESR